jgi:hypothetical protein
MAFGQQTDQGLSNQVLLSGDPDTDRLLDVLPELGVLVSDGCLGLGGDDLVSSLAGLFGQLVEICLDDPPQRGGELERRQGVCSFAEIVRQNLGVGDNRLSALGRRLTPPDHRSFTATTIDPDLELIGDIASVDWIEDGARVGVGPEVAFRAGPNTALAPLTRCVATTGSHPRDLTRWASTLTDLTALTSPLSLALPLPLPLALALSLSLPLPLTLTLALALALARCLSLTGDPGPDSFQGAHRL